MTMKPFNELSPEEQRVRLARAARAESVNRENQGEKAEAEETLARTGDGADGPAEAPRFGLDPDTVSRIKREAREYVDQQLRERGLASKKDQEAKLRDDLIHQLRKEAGLTDHLDDLIEYTPNLPPYADRFVIDGVEYHHGYTATMRRTLFDHLRWVEAAGWVGEDLAGNPNRKYYRRPEAITGSLRNMRFHDQGWAIARETTLSAHGGVINAPLNNAMVGGLPARGR